MVKDLMFYNSDYIVIEYVDLIKAPYLTLLSQIKHNKKLNELINLDKIKYLNVQSLIEWYVFRKNQNFLLDLKKKESKITIQQFDTLLGMQLQLSPLFFSNSPLFKIGKSLKLMKIQKLAKDILIYYPFDPTFAKADLENILEEKFVFMDNFSEVVDKAKSNSTYILSDIEKVDIIRKKGYLDYSSVTIASDYRYNRKNMKDFKINFDELFKEHPFKWSYINGLSL